MKEEKFSVSRFLLVMAVIFIGVTLIIRILLPKEMWYAQIHSSFSTCAIVFTVSQLMNCFAEWVFHRYMLHAPLVPGFARLFKQHHDIHHRLTNIAAVPKDAPKNWKNNYPIIEEYQYEASYFPWYSYLGFLFVASPAIALAQWLLPSWPVTLVSVVSVGWSLCMYELIHAVEHLPMTFWQRIFCTFGRFGEKVYSFHVVHHAHIKCNEAVSGFLCGIPLADIAFGTLKVPEVVFLDGAPVIKEDLDIPRPHFALLRWLDSKVEPSIIEYRLRVIKGQAE